MSLIAWVLFSGRGLSVMVGVFGCVSAIRRNIPFNVSSQYN